MFSLFVLCSCVLFVGCNPKNLAFDPCKNNPAGGIEQEASHEKKYSASHDKTWNAVRTALEQLGYSTKADPSSGKIFTDPLEIPCPGEAGAKQITLTKWYSAVTATVSGPKVRLGVSFQRKHLGIKKSDLVFPEKENEISRDFFAAVDRLLDSPPPVTPPTGGSVTGGKQPPPPPSPKKEQEVRVSPEDNREVVARRLKYTKQEPLLQLSSPTFAPSTIRPNEWLTQTISVTYLDPEPGRTSDLTAVFVISFGDIQIPMQRKFKDQEQGRMGLTLRLRIPKDIPPGDCTVKSQVSAGGLIEHVEGSFRVTP
jgi:hypothetical protein